MNFFDQLLVLFGARSAAKTIVKADAANRQETAELIRQTSYAHDDRETELEELIEKLEQKIDELEDRVFDLEMRVDDLETDKLINDYDDLSERVGFLEGYIMDPSREDTKEQEPEA